MLRETVQSWGWLPGLSIPVPFLTHQLGTWGKPPSLPAPQFPYPSTQGGVNSHLRSCVRRQGVYAHGASRKASGVCWVLSG